MPLHRSQQAGLKLSTTGTAGIMVLGGGIAGAMATTDMTETETGPAGQIGTGERMTAMVAVRDTVTGDETEELSTLGPVTAEVLYTAPSCRLCTHRHKGTL